MGNIHIQEINKDTCINFVRRYHYSKVLPRLTKHYLGVYEDKILVGCITLGWGTQPLQTITKLFPNQNLTTQDYFEIGKMAFIPSKNGGNFGSKALSVLVKWCKENTKCIFLYTLADGIMGKCGYVYQASSFYYLGSFKTSVYLDIKTKEKIHPRSAKLLLDENAKYLNKAKVCWLTHDFCKLKGIDKINGLMFRYIMPLTKLAKSIVQEGGHKVMSYPKDKDLIFEKRIENGKFVKIPIPDFNAKLLNYNPQREKENMEDMF